MAGNYKNKYPIRRDSLIAPWGIGAIVPFPDEETLMVASIDFWFDGEHANDIEKFEIDDKRLTKRLGGKRFVSPPDFRTPDQDKALALMKIPAVRFPLWHYCPVCGNMEKLGVAGVKSRCSGENRKNLKQGTYCSKTESEYKRPYLIPDRFIAVCEKGHIEDFPIMEWVHRNNKREATPNCKLVRSTGGSTSSLSGIRYTCTTCGISWTMNGAFSKTALGKINYTCTCNKPWLGQFSKAAKPDSDEELDCGLPLRVLQRGASNVWFANIVSSVYIPWIPEVQNENTNKCIKKGIEKFKSSIVDGELDVEGIKTFVNGISQMIKEFDTKNPINEPFAINEIISTINNCKKVDAVSTEEDYRKEEFEVLTRPGIVGKPSEELYVENKQISLYDSLDFLKSISLVKKLRETRVFNGFRRLSPSSDYIAPISSKKDFMWLPAVKNSGEGIMFEFDFNKLISWANKKNVQSRVEIINSNLRQNGKLQKDGINPIFVLLHTFAHCLITALSNESGYSNASIREKIYCNMYENGKNPEMCGILIYTASGDSEGSLGGLVRQGGPGRIENVIKRAINDAQWCAADPVCIQSPGQGQDGCNLAACHNCALLPETSCENRNMYLDRGLLIGTLADKSLGFFNTL